MHTFEVTFSVNGGTPVSEVITALNRQGARDLIRAQFSGQRVWIRSIEQLD